MDVLGDYGSSSDSEESAADSPPKRQTALPSSSSLAESKRPRINSENNSNEAMLPPPPNLEQSQQQMLLGPDDKVDFLSVKQAAFQQQTTGDKKKASSVNFSQRFQQISNGAPWAEQLQEQHDFYNPHFFESVVESFGIQTVGTNIACLNNVDDEAWRTSMGLTSSAPDPTQEREA